MFASSTAEGRLRLAAASLLGVLVAGSGIFVQVPGNGEILVVAWLAGLAASFVLPGWRGMVVVSASAAVAAAVIGSFTGAMWGPGLGVLVLGMVAPLVALGALTKSFLRITARE
jgi:hypothetical protein